MPPRARTSSTVSSSSRLMQSQSTFPSGAGTSSARRPIANDRVVPMSQQAIGEQLGIDRTTRVELVEELERLGSARRERTARDRRSYSITLTPQGNLHQRRAFQAFDAATKEFFAPLSADERETF